MLQLEKLIRKLDVKWLDLKDVKKMSNEQLRGYDTIFQELKDIEDKKIYPIDIFDSKKYIR